MLGLSLLITVVLMVPLGRLERPTNGLGNRCSIHLSYRGIPTVRARSPILLTTTSKVTGKTFNPKRLALYNFLVEIEGFEPSTSAMRTQRSPS